MSVIITSKLVKEFIPIRKSSSRKGDNGKVLVLGGSYIYHGAPALSSLAALRTGADLVYTCVPKINVQSTRAVSPNLIVIPLADSKLTRGAVNKLLGQIPSDLDSSTIGMGLSIQDPEALKLLVKSLLDRDVRLSLDASTLVNYILPLLSGKNVIVTPHQGEFKRMFGEVPPESKKSRIAMVEKFAKKHSVTIILKGSTDIISNGTTTYLNTKNIPAMTVGGTGDILSGIIAGILAQNRDVLESAVTATYFNGLAGKMTQKKFGTHMTATDLLDVLPIVMKSFDKIK